MVYSLSLAAIAAGIVSVAARAWAWNIAPGSMPLSTSLRNFVAVSVVVFCFGYFIRGFVSDDIALIAAGAFGVLWAFFLATRRRYQRGLAALSLVLVRSKEPKDVVARIARLTSQGIDKLAPPAATGLAIQASGSLAAAGEYKEALTLLERVEPPENLRANYAQAKATCLLRLDRTTDAKAELSAVEMSAESPFAPWFDALLALIDAIEGGADKALATVKRLWPDAAPDLRDSLRVVRAHAYACRGEDSHAQKELDDVLERYGVTGLLGFVEPVGPATELARATIARQMSTTK